MNKHYKDYVLEDPKHRNMNDCSDDDFVAFDFETMTPVPTSACAIGLVKVRDGHVVQKFYSLINPIRDKYTEKELNKHIHGISLRETEKGATFCDLFESIKQFIDGYRLLAHNKSFDVNVMAACMDYYGLEGIRLDDTICSYEETGLSLEACCNNLGIPILKHHDALWDAETTAAIHLCHIGKPMFDAQPGSVGSIIANKDKRTISKSHRGRLEDIEICNKDTPFYQSNVVITGIFDSYPIRDELAGVLKGLGAKVVSSINKKTTIAVVGQGAGPKKLEQIEDLRSEGVNIRIMAEKELLKILDNALL